MSILLDPAQPNEVTEELILLVELGDATELTLGEGGTGIEDKRYQYN